VTTHENELVLGIYRAVIIQLLEIVVEGLPLSPPRTRHRVLLTRVSSIDQAKIGGHLQLRQHQVLLMRDYYEHSRNSKHLYGYRLVGRFP
jgi:hypothetical protein